MCFADSIFLCIMKDSTGWLRVELIYALQCICMLIDCILIKGGKIARISIFKNFKKIKI